jgi:hypothetical protein
MFNNYIKWTYNKMRNKLIIKEIKLISFIIKKLIYSNNNIIIIHKG